jgi:hypothetical protein
VNLAAIELRKLLECLAAVFVMVAKHGYGYEHFISVQTWVVTMKK